MHKKNIHIGIFVTLILVLFSTSRISGQELYKNNEDSLSIISLIGEAEELYSEGKLTEALNRAEQAHQLVMKTSMTEFEAGIFTLMGESFQAKGAHSQAIPYYLRAASEFGYRNDFNSLVKVYSHIAECYHLEMLYDKEGEYYMKALSLTNLSEEKSRLSSLAGNAFLQCNKPDTAAMFFKKQLEYLTLTGRDPAQAFYSLVIAYRAVPDYDSCVFFNKRLVEYYRGRNDYREMSGLENNNGYYYTLDSDYSKGLECYSLALEYGRKAGLSARDLAIMTANTGVCYQNMNKREMARLQFRKSLDLLKDGEYAPERSGIENIMALIYFNENDLYNAGTFAKKSIESARLSKDPLLLSDACYTYSQVLKSGNDPEGALEYYEKHLRLKDSMVVARKLQEQRIASRKAELEKSENDLQLRLKEDKVRELAFEQLNLQLEKEEQAKSLLEKERDLQLLEREKMHQSMVISNQQNLVEKQAREKQILEQEQRISNLRLEQEERQRLEQEKEIKFLEQKQQLDKLELEKQKTTRKALTWIIILMITVAIVILGSLITTRRKNLLLARQKKEIEEKNYSLEQQNEEIIAQRDEIEAQRNMVFEQKEAIEQFNSEIMKSIEYAKRIQAASLPDLSVLEGKVKEHFLLFKPRDIVSGDFYWVGTVENKTIFIVADCTGHGVPGAFMSILGTSLIKEIILKEYLTHPGVILRRLRKEIINALGQKGLPGEQKDGMDLALLTINHESGMAEYAGAYNSLYLVRKKEIPGPEFGDIRCFDSSIHSRYHLWDIPADKMPIAYFDRMDKFNTREFAVHPDDRFYLFTDGFADQFGGEKGKKFMYKPFKRLILANSENSMAEQKMNFTRALENWMGDVEQIDDICLMGIRI